jgi:hypothetical protein
MTDALLEQWVDLSGCIAQNLLRGANAGPGEIEVADDCQTINFEPPPLDDIFRDDLNAAAHYGKDRAGFDYGRLASNVDKISRYVITVLERGLIFDPTEDIRSLALSNGPLSNAISG